MKSQHKDGAALIEATLVVMVLCMVLFGGFQISRLFAAKEIIDYSAMAGARAKSVGLNSFMVHKVVRVATIPNAGRIRNPRMEMQASDAYDWDAERPGVLWDSAVAARAPTSPQTGIELMRIPFYLGAEWYGQLPAILDYEDWHTVGALQEFDQGGEQVWVSVSQRVPVRFPFSRAFYDRDSLVLRSGRRFMHGARMANHSELYLEDY